MAAADKKGADKDKKGKGKEPTPEDIMPMAAVKALLKQVRKEGAKALSCAVALPDGGKDEAIIILDRTMGAKALRKYLIKQAESTGLELDDKSIRYGKASTDETNESVLVIKINKPTTGDALHKALKKRVKQLFTDVSLTVDPGIENESDDGPKPAQPPTGAAPATSAAPATGTDQTARQPETSAPAADAPATEAAAPPPPPPPPPSPAPEQPRGETEHGAGADLQALTRTLTDAVREMIAAVTQNPAEKPNLMGLAAAAQTSLKRGDAQGTQAGIKALRDGVARAKAAPPGGNGATRQPPAPSPAIAKARQAWVATRQKVDTDIGNLHTAFSSAFKGHGRHGDITKAFRTRVDTVLGKLDEALAHKLDAVNQATDHGARAKLVEEAHALIADYTRHVASDPTIAELDRNPFVPLSIQKTMTTTLGALSRAIR